MLPIRDVNPRTRPAVVTWTLVAATVGVFAVQVGALGPGPSFTVLRFGAFVPADVASRPFELAPTLIAYAFLHGDLWHLIGNLFFLGVFGDNVEERLGPLRFLAFYLAGAAAAALAHGLASGGSPVPLVGASGAISAVLGAYVLWYPGRRVQAFVAPFFVPWLLISVFVRVPRFYLLWFPAWLYIGYWAAIQMVEAGGALVAGDAGLGGVAWWAHVGGFAFGLIVGAARRR